MQKVPLPPELVEHFGHMQANCMIGLFPQIERAWLTIDSDIYVWRFADCQDLAYFDGLSDTIVSVALLTPKTGIFRPHIKYLLCLTTAVEIILLGVTFTDGGSGGVALGYSEMQLLPEPLFTLSTDSTHMLCVRGTANGRIFLGGKVRKIDLYQGSNRAIVLMLFHPNLLLCNSYRRMVAFTSLHISQRKAGLGKKHKKSTTQLLPYRS